MKTSDYLVTILIPAYNVEKYIAEAVYSIQNQSHSNIEILIIDDGSVDNTNSIIRNLKEKDSRIVLVTNESNLGLIKTLNKGIELAKGKYIARMDSDDIAHPNRIEKQLGTMLSNPNVDFVGCLLKVINEKNRFLYYLDAFDVDDNFVAGFISMFESPIAHPGLLIKSEVIKKYKYRDEQEYKHVEDFDMFSRMLADGVKYKCHREYLLYYRINHDGVTRQNAEIQRVRTLKILQRNSQVYLGVNIERRLYDFINFYDISDINYHNAKSAINKLDDLKKEYELTYQKKSKRLTSWVNQRKIKIAKALLVERKTILSILLMPNIIEMIKDRYTYFNILNTLIRIVNSKF